MNHHATMIMLIGQLLALSSVNAVIFSEDFADDPAANGWKIYGDANLFQWNTTNQNLEVTWDSSQMNSYFYRPLNTILTTNDDFALEFDLRLDDAEVRGFGFEIAVGFLNYTDATGADFFRGTGRNSPNLAEFNYFPDFGFGPTIAATTVDAARTNFIFYYDIQPLDTGITNHIVLTHVAGTAGISGQVFVNGVFYTALPLAYSTAHFFDFRVDTFSVSSFSDAHSGGSILAHGVVDNFVVTVPPAPIQDLTGNFTNGVWQAQFISQSNWFYTMERTADFQLWANVGVATPGNATNLFLSDTNAVADKAFYRVKAERL